MNLGERVKGSEIANVGKMPCCGGVIKFQWGPEAGLSRNARCAHCHAIFCVDPFGWELVDLGLSDEIPW